VRPRKRAIILGPPPPSLSSQKISPSQASKVSVSSMDSELHSGASISMMDLSSDGPQCRPSGPKSSLSILPSFLPSDEFPRFAQGPSRSRTLDQEKDPSASIMIGEERAREDLLTVRQKVKLLKLDKLELGQSQILCKRMA